MRRMFLALACVAITTGCTESVTMSPQNDIAMNNGPVQAQFTAYGTGRGEVAMTTPDGQKYTGSFLLLRNETVFTLTAALLMEVYGGAVVKAEAAEYVNSMPVWSPGTADAYNPSGTAGHCELMANNVTGHGQGACKFTDGAIYTMQY